MSPWVIFLIAVVALVVLGTSVRIVKQYERGVVLRFGKLSGLRQPGPELHLAVRRSYDQGEPADHHHGP